MYTNVCMRLRVTGRTTGVRYERDVEMLVDRALAARGKFRSPTRITNMALRAWLTPKFATKKIFDLQEDLGLHPESA
jgi:hypothetical protein